MSARFTLGIEEEFQIVDCRTGQLAPQIKTILAKGTPAFGDKLKPEMLQSTVELVSPVFPNIMLARIEMRKWRRMLAELLAEQGLALVSAGTHPSAHWGDQVRSESERYAELEDEYQDVGRSILIFGLHVHVGVENKEVAIALMNQLRTWLPHLLALSSNSPFWAGRYTGLKSYRSVVWKRFPRSGLPEVFATADDFDKYVQTLVVTNCIDNGKRIWWDIRPHPFFETIEFRVFDMPATFDDMIALAALSQALVAKLCWLYEHGTMTQVLPRRFIDENKWRAMRYGLDAELIDFVRGWRLSARDAISELLDFVDDVLDDLGSRSEIDHVRLLLEDPRGTGARRVGLSGPAVADRLRRLEDSGTLSYRAEVSPRALGYTICAIVRISPTGGGLRLIPGIAREVPNVTECYRITGEDCFFMKVWLHSIEDLEPVLDLFTPHGRTTTSIVHSAPVPARPLPVPA